MITPNDFDVLTKSAQIAVIVWRFRNNFVSFIIEIFCKVSDFIFYKRQNSQKKYIKINAQVC